MTMDYERRIAELEAENEQLKIGIDEGVRPLPYWERLKKAEVDAERYRWLRQHRVRVFVDDRDGYSCLLFDHENPELLDAAIDATRETRSPRE